MATALPRVAYTKIASCVLKDRLSLSTASDFSPLYKLLQNLTYINNALVYFKMHFYCILELPKLFTNVAAKQESAHR